MRFTAAVVICTLAIATQVCDGGIFCWTVEADDKLAQVECNNLSSRSYAHTGTVEFGLSIAVGATFDGLLGLILASIDFMIFLVFWMIEWFILAIVWIWFVGYTACVNAFRIAIDGQWSLMGFYVALCVAALPGIPAFFLMLASPSERDGPVVFFWPCVYFSFVLAAMIVGSLMLVVCLLVMPLLFFIPLSVLLAVVWVGLFLASLLLSVLLFLSITVVSIYALLLLGALITLVGLLLMAVIMFLPMFLVVLLTALVLGCVARMVQNVNQPIAQAPHGNLRRAAKQAVMVAGKIGIALIELVFDLSLVNAAFVAFSELSGQRFEYVRRGLAQSLLEVSPATSWFASVAGFVEVCAEAMGRLAPVLTELMDMTCVGPNSMFSGCQLTMALFVIKWMNSKSVNLQLALNYTVMTAEVYGSWRLLLAKLGKVVLMKTLEILLQSSAYVVVFRPIYKAACDWEGDIILAVVGHAILVVSALRALYKAPSVMGFGHADAEGIFAWFRRLLQIFFGYWTETSVEAELREYGNPAWVRDERRVESFLGLTAEYLSMGFTIFPLGLVLQKTMEGFNEGFIWGPGRAAIRADNALPEPDKFAWGHKILAVLRAIAISVTVVVPDGAKLAFWLLAAIFTMGKTLCDEVKAKAKPRAVKYNHEDFQFFKTLMNKVKSIAWYLVAAGGRRNRMPHGRSSASASGKEGGSETPGTSSARASGEEDGSGIGVTAGTSSALASGAAGADVEPGPVGQVNVDEVMPPVTCFGMCCSWPSVMEGGAVQPTLAAVSEVFDGTDMIYSI